MQAWRFIKGHRQHRAFLFHVPSNAKSLNSGQLHCLGVCCHGCRTHGLVTTKALDVETKVHKQSNVPDELAVNKSIKLVHSVVPAFAAGESFETLTASLTVVQGESCCNIRLGSI